MVNPIKVLYITGSGRSGSTVLANALGEAHGMVSTGETRLLWERGILKDWLCGCGERFSVCFFWNEVLGRAFGGDSVPAHHMSAVQSSICRVRNVPLILRARHHFAALPEIVGPYLENLSRLYQALSDATESAMLVDSSKNPIYGFLLSWIPEIDLRILHLTRDPRGVAHSFEMSRARADAELGAAMDRLWAGKSALLWDIWNTTAVRLWGESPRYLRLRYEDFIVDPRRHLTEILHFAGVDSDLGFLDGNVLLLGRNHTVSGNPMRMQIGRIELKPDLEWVRAMPSAKKILVTSIALPLLQRFSYPIKTGSDATSQRPKLRIEDMTGASRLFAKARRNLMWGRTWGWRNLIEEHDWNAFVAVPRAFRKASWRRRNGSPPGSATPLFLVGVQRSGTNMIVHGLDESPEFEVFNEGNRKAFDNFKLRSNDVLGQLIQQSRHRHVLFKPLCDSHRVDELLDSVRSGRPPLAIWAYRDFEGRVRSAVAKFADSNIQVMREFAAGGGLHRWQVQRLSDESIGFIKSLDLESMSAESGAALFWLVRNRLYFDLGLHEREDVMLASYNGFISDPPRVMQALCSFIGFGYQPRLVKHVARRGRGGKHPLEIDSRVRHACLELQERLSKAAEEKLTALSIPAA